MAVFGASDAANKKVMASLARARGCELAVVPVIDGGRALSLSYERRDGTLHARFYVRAVAGYDLDTQAFYSVLGVDAVVLVGTDAAARRAAKKIFSTYGDALVLSGKPTADEVERAVIDGFRAKRIKGRAFTTPSAAYVARVKALAAAVEIAVAVGPRSIRRFHEAIRGDVLYPRPQYATVASLAQTESEFFVYWNEGSGPHVEKFWREVARQKLPFRRRDVLAEVLAKGRITNRGDYDIVTDLLGDERLTDAQRARLDRMLGAYAGA